MRKVKWELNTGYGKNLIGYIDITDDTSFFDIQEICLEAMMEEVIFSWEFAKESEGEL